MLAGAQSGNAEARSTGRQHDTGGTRVTPNLLTPNLHLPNEGQSPQMRLAPTTRPSVRHAIRISPRAPTTKGRKPCFDISRKFVRRPTPAKVSRNAHFDRFPSEATCPLSNV